MFFFHSYLMQSSASVIAACPVDTLRMRSLQVDESVYEVVLQDGKKPQKQ